MHGTWIVCQTHHFSPFILHMAAAGASSKRRPNQPQLGAFEVGPRLPLRLSEISRSRATAAHAPKATHPKKKMPLVFDAWIRLLDVSARGTELLAESGAPVLQGQYRSSIAWWIRRGISMGGYSPCAA